MRLDNITLSKGVGWNRELEGWQQRAAVEQAGSQMTEMSWKLREECQEGGSRIIFMKYLLC